MLINKELLPAINNLLFRTEKLSQRTDSPLVKHTNGLIFGGNKGGVEWGFPIDGGKSQAEYGKRKYNHEKWRRSGEAGGG